MLPIVFYINRLEFFKPFKKLKWIYPALLAVRLPLQDEIIHMEDR